MKICLHQMERPFFAIQNVRNRKDYIMPKRSLKILKISSIVFLYGILVNLTTHAQTLLSTGDISLVGFQSGFTATPTPKDRFAFVLLKPVEAGTQIIFNDNAVISTNPVRFCKNESMAIWQSTTPLPIGTVVVITESDTVATFGKVTGSLALSQSGDQIIGMQANGADTTLLAGLSLTTWATDCASTCGGTNNNFTCLPPPLVNGATALSLNTTINNAFLNVSQLNGTPSEILAIINNPSNWTLSDNEQDWTSGYWQFTVLTSIGKKSDSNTFATVLPNPSNGQLSIRTKGEWSRATISNALGIKVFEIKKESESSFDLSDLPSGIYFVQIFNKGQKIISTNRWVKK